MGWTQVNRMAALRRALHFVRNPCVLQVQACSSTATCCLLGRTHEQLAPQRQHRAPTMPASRSTSTAAMTMPSTAICCRSSSPISEAMPVPLLPSL